MKHHREMVIGLMAALISFIIISGSLAVSIAEMEVGFHYSRNPIPSTTHTKSPTHPTTTPQPGDSELIISFTPGPTSSELTHPSPTSSCQIPGDWIAITIQVGDTLESIAKSYQTTTDTLMMANCLLIPDLSPGARLYVPQPVCSITPTSTSTYQPTATRCQAPPSGWVTYTVVAGDTLYSIAVSYGLTVPELQAANCMGSSTEIYIGEVVWVPNIPTVTPIFSNTPHPSNTMTPSSSPTVTDTPISSSTPTPTPTRTRWPTRTRRPTRTPRPTRIGDSNQP